MARKKTTEDVPKMVQHTYRVEVMQQPNNSPMYWVGVDGSMLYSADCRQIPVPFRMMLESIVNNHAGSVTL